MKRLSKIVCYFVFAVALGTIANYFDGEEQDYHKMKKMLMDINDKQPLGEQLGNTLWKDLEET